MPILDELTCGLAGVSPPEVAGSITAVFYRTDTALQALGAIPPTLSLGTKEYLKVAWTNTGTKAIAGTVAVQVTGPDGTTVTLEPGPTILALTEPGGTAGAEFSPFVVEKAGTYTAKVTLKGQAADMAKPITLHEVTLAVAKGAAAVAVDVTTQMIGLVLVVGLMAAMASAVSEAAK